MPLYALAKVQRLVASDRWQLANQRAVNTQADLGWTKSQVQAVLLQLAPTDFQKVVQNCKAWVRGGVIDCDQYVIPWDEQACCRSSLRLRSTLVFSVKIAIEPSRSGDLVAVVTFHLSS